MLKVESERFVPKTGREFEVPEEEFSAFLGINKLIRIHKLLSIDSYWIADEGLGNPLIQKTMARTPFMEILRNIQEI